MKFPAFHFAFLLTAITSHAAPVPIFDGKSLAGWEGDAKLWRVQDGMITGGSLTAKVPHNDFLATIKSYSNFELRVKLKLSGTEGFINSGVQIRSLRVPGSHEMSGYQVDYGKGWYGKLYDESRRNKVVGESKDMAAATAAIKEGDWNEYRIRAEGPRIQSWINGVPALDYTEADPNIAQDGHIGIQVHGGGKALVQVKEVTIEELPPTPNAPTWEKLGGVGGARAKVQPPKKGAANDAKPANPMKTGNAANAPPKTPEEERSLLKVPEGFEVELVAAEDIANGIGKFVPIAFDQRGALWTTTALEYPVDGNENPAAADALYASKAKDKVLVFDRDDVAATLPSQNDLKAAPPPLTSPAPFKLKKTPRVFAEGLAIPLGVLPYKNGCYVQHGHDIVFLEDTDGDGCADKRTVILTGFGVQDSHLFPHQFMRAPGGWIWMAQGAFNYGKVSRPGHPEETQQFDQTRMAKFRPDGSQFTITSNGPCNIWGLVLNGEGEAFIQEANDFGYPVMPFHEYANYPGCSDRQWKSYAPEFPGTASDFRMGGTGLSGLALLDAGWVKLLEAGKSDQSSVVSNHSGDALTGALITDHRSLITSSQTVLVANPITNRINAIKMHRDGPRWRLEKLPDFLESGDPWFRPIAITIGPDGCLYIVDWYNKIISHNEVPRNHPDRDKTRGRIWRVKAKAQKPFDVPDFSKLSGDGLIAKLGGESLAQHHLAWQAIVDRDMKDLAPKLREIVAGRTTAANTNDVRGVGRASRLPADASRVGNTNVEPRANANPRADVPRETRDTAGGMPTLPDAKRIATLWVLEGLGKFDDAVLLPLLADANRNMRRESVRAIGNAHLQIAEVSAGNEPPPKNLANNPYLHTDNIGWLSGSRAALAPLGHDNDPEVRAEMIRAAATAGACLPTIAGDPAFRDQQGLALRIMMAFAREPLAEPVAPSTRNGKPVKVREAYDREFERYLVRMFLEGENPETFPGYLDSDTAKSMPIEARLLATLALEPKSSASRVAKLLPQLQRAPGQEEVLRLAQFPDEPGVGEALRAILSNTTTRGAALESLLAVKTRLDAKKLTPFLTDTATALLTSKDAGGVELATRVASAFQLGGMESALASAVSAGISEIHDWVKGEPAHQTRIELSPSALQALRALHEMRSDKVELFEHLARLASNSDVRDEALAALASSKAAGAPARVLALYPNLTPPQRRTALERLSATKSGAGAILAALNDGKLAASDLDGSILDRLQAVLGANDPAITKLVDKLGALFRPVLALDGSEAAWTQTNVTLEGPCTIEAWVRLDPQDRKIGNADGIAGAPGQLDFNFFGELPRIYAFPPLADVVVAKKPLTPGLWTHVSATRDAKGIWKIYVDGELDATGTKHAPHRIENIRIAWTSAKGGTRGALSEVRMWNLERSADEIRAASDRTVAADGRRQALRSNGEGGTGASSNESPPPSVGGYEGLVFASVSDGWGHLQAGAKIIKTSDYPPILTGDEAAALDAKYAKFRSLSEKTGDPVRGKVTALVCQACHLMGTTGGNIGPNLSGVGAMGAEAILRNIIQPNAAMENGYRIYRVEMKNGDLIDALYVSEDKAAVVVRLPGADDRRIAKSDIRSTKFLRRSLMAEGLLDGMTPEQVSDLFAYLRTLK